MADMKISVDQLSEAIEGVLKQYNETVVKGVKREAKRAMKDLVANTKADAPVGHRRSKHYRDSIASRVERETRDGIVLTWYVKGSDYRLSHLLNNGHALHQGGRVAGTNFIGKNADRIETWYLERIEEVLRNG